MSVNLVQNDNRETGNEQRDYTIAAVDRALQVLEALADTPDIGVTELASRLGLTKSLTFRIMYTLEGRGFVVKDPDRATYALGFRVAHIGDQVARQRTLLIAAGPVMDGLRDQTGESVNLIVREGSNIVCVATREGRHSIRLFAAVGRVGPLHAGGASTVLLAFAPGPVVDEVLSGPLTRYTQWTVTDPDQLRQVLTRVRSDGFHVAQNDLDEGAFSIAAPIRSPSGEVVAALSVAGPVGRLDDGRQTEHLTAVLAAAQEVSRRLISGAERAEQIARALHSRGA